jgi:dihydroorotate dehydrogenase (fumarate)
MNRTLSVTTERIYKHIGKPLLFKISPDTVHHRLLSTGQLVQRSRLIRGGLGHAWAYQNPKVLAQTIHGITFTNPVGLSAGFDKNFVLPPLMRSVGFGFMEGGSITLRECKGNPKPWFYRLPKSQSLVVHAGLANDGVAKITDRLQNYSAQTLTGFPINISVAKTNSPETCTDTQAIADYVGSLRHIKRAQVGDMITLNISCPNTYGGEPFTTPDRLDQLLSAVDRLRLKQPIFVKMPSHLSWREFDQLLRVIATHHIDGVTIGNLAKDRKAAKLSDPLPDTIKGGLSGKPTQKPTDDLICKTYLKYGKRFVIIGVGGIFTAEDAYRKIQLGASLVELITGMIFEGPQRIGQINQGIVALLERDGYKHISEAVGTIAAAH